MNDPIEIAELPVLDPDSFTGIDPNFLAMAQPPTRLFQLVVIAVTVVIAVVVTPWACAAGLALVGIAEAILMLRKLAFPYIGYQVREHDFSVRSGLLRRTVQSVPYNRIQTSTVAQGPWQRRYGLATLVVSPARLPVSLPGLTLEDANKLRAFVAETAALDEDNNDGA